MRCPYCETENQDGELFCIDCGRPLKKIIKKKKTKKKYKESPEGDMVCSSPCAIIESEDMDGFLKFPDRQIYQDGEYELIFYRTAGMNLVEYLEQNQDSLSQSYIDLENRLLAILGHVQKMKLIIGSFDLEDLYLPDGEPSLMQLRVVRPFLEDGEMPEKYECGELAAPEVRNRDLPYVGKRTDVYLAAILFNRLIIGDKYSAGNIDSQLFWAYHYTNAAFEKRYRKFHHWLGNGLSMFPAKRMRDIKNCLISFEKCCILENSCLRSDLRICDVLETNVGKGKKAVMKDAGRLEEEWNEDAIEKWQCKEKNLTAYLLADGISNCSIGSGYLASNIIRENFKSVLTDFVDETFEDLTYDLVEEIVYRIVEKSNADIWKKACEYPQQSGSIMGSTFLFLLIYEGVLYSYSMGDSCLYLVRRGNAIPLNSPDNAGFTALKAGKSYAEYRQMEGRDSIALYIGGEYARTQSDYYQQRPIDTLCLQEEDVILAASDGVIDYFGTKLSDTRWDKETALVKYLSDKNKTIEQKA
ncbi:MAG: protein phosphatase 2C domain-containing protein, partial [Lachnospiraceae bacterium]|nr:protein phosphatase 2C domain-containing protein [Lachnospiraceae bacterium]